MSKHVQTPWMKLTTEGAQYAKRGGRYLKKEAKAGRLKAAQVGGKGEYLTRAEWLDEWIEAQVKPVMVTPRRMAR